MSGKRSTHNFVTENSKERTKERIDYVIIKPDGRPVRSESGILMKHSSVIKKRVKEAETFRNSSKREDAPGMDFCSEWLYGRNKDELELEYPTLKHKDVKMAMKYLNSLDCKDDLSSKYVLNVDMPITCVYIVHTGT